MLSIYANACACTRFRQAGGAIIEGLTLGAGREVWGQPRLAGTGTSLPITHALWLQGVKADPQCPTGAWMHNLCRSPTEAQARVGCGQVFTKCTNQKAVIKLSAVRLYYASHIACFLVGDFAPYTK